MKTRATQQQVILEYLQENKGITSLQAFNLFGMLRVAAVIFNLRAKGHDIRNRPLTVKNRYGDYVHIVEYYLHKDENANESHENTKGV